MKYKNDNSQTLMLGSVHLEADIEDPRFLRFKDAVLARAEVNANQDEVDETGVRELAATIAGTAIDLDHDPSQNVGYFTAGRAVDGALRVDGVLWTDRCVALGVDTSEVENGTYKLSIEATADTAECSVCGTVHDGFLSYCQHLKNKLLYKAIRKLRGLRAWGGAITKRPAGTDTTFNTGVGLFFIASHQVQEEREDVSDADKKRAEKEYGDVEFADRSNKKYPVSTKEQTKAAWSYINMPKNAEKYSDSELKTIKNRIKDAAKKFGVEISDDKNTEKSSEESTMDDEKKEVAPDDEKKEGEEVKAAEEVVACDTPVSAEVVANDVEMKKSLDDLTAQFEAKQAELKAAEEAKTSLSAEKVSLEARVADLENKVKALQASLADEQGKVVAHKTETLKSKMVGSLLTEEEFEAKKDTLLTLSEDVIALMLRAKPTETAPSTRYVAAEETTPDNGRVKITLF